GEQGGTLRSANLSHCISSLLHPSSLIPRATPRHGIVPSSNRARGARGVRMMEKHPKSIQAADTREYTQMLRARGAVRGYQRVFAAVLIFAFAAAGQGWAQEYPSRPV